MEEWVYQGGTFTNTDSWMQGGSGSGGNMILEWNTDVATTRKQVKIEDRKSGMQISYNHPDNGWTNEQYLIEEIGDVSFANDNNWESNSAFILSKIKDILGDEKENTIYNKDNAVWNKGYYNSNFESVSSGIFVSLKIDIIKFRGKTLELKIGGYSSSDPVKSGFLCSDNVKNIIDASGTDIKTFIIPEDALYFYASVNTGNVSDYYIKIKETKVKTFKNVVSLEELNKVEESFNEVIVDLKTAIQRRKFDNTSGYWQDGYYYNSGVLAAASTHRCIKIDVSNFIGQTVVVINAYWSSKQSGFIDKSGVYTEYDFYNIRTATIPENTQYLIVSSSKLVNDYCCVELIPFFEDRITAAELYQAEKAGAIPLNLFNYIRYDRYLNVEGNTVNYGTEGNRALYSIEGYPVKEGDKLYYTGKYGLNGKAVAYIIKNKEGDIIEYLSSDETTNTVFVEELEIIAPANSDKIFFSSLDNTFEVKKYPSGYGSYLRIREINEKIKRILPFSDKELAVLGDSISSGSGATKKENSCAYLLADRFNMNLTINAVPGSSVRNNGSSSFFSRVTLFVEELKTEAPYIIIFGGTNDANVEDVNEIIGEIDSDDATTFYGAYNYILKYILSNKPKSHIGLVTPYNVNNVALITSEKCRIIAEAVVKIGEKFSLPTLNLYKESGLPINGITDTSYLLASDKEHPNDLGHERLSYKFQELLLRL